MPLNLATKSCFQGCFLPASWFLMQITIAMLLELRNTAEKTVFMDGQPVTQKPVGGIETKSVAATVKKYCGMVEFSQRSDKFFTRIVLLI